VLLRSILQDRNIRNPLLTLITKTYENNETNINVDTTLTQPTKLTKSLTWLPPPHMCTSARYFVTAGRIE
jgi:hypothetical protein